MSDEADFHGPEEAASDTNPEPGSSEIDRAVKEGIETFETAMRLGVDLGDPRETQAVSDMLEFERSGGLERVAELLAAESGQVLQYIDRAQRALDSLLPLPLPDRNGQAGIEEGYDLPDLFGKGWVWVHREMLDDHGSIDTPKPSDEDVNKPPTENVIIILKKAGDTTELEGDYGIEILKITEDGEFSLLAKGELPLDREGNIATAPGQREEARLQAYSLQATLDDLLRQQRASSANPEDWSRLQSEIRITQSKRLQQHLLASCGIITPDDSPTIDSHEDVKKEQVTSLIFNTNLIESIDPETRGRMPENFQETMGNILSEIP